MIRSYKDLEVWKKSIQLVAVCYPLASRFPAHERFELASQLRRAATSVAANIAEGHGRFHRGEYLHHLSIARGSLMELETHLAIAQRLGYLTDAELAPVLDLSDHITRMLSRLASRLRA